MRSLEAHVGVFPGENLLVGEEIQMPKLPRGFHPREIPLSATLTPEALDHLYDQEWWARKQQAYMQKYHKQLLPADKVSDSRKANKAPPEQDTNEEGQQGTPPSGTAPPSDGAGGGREGTETPL